MAMASKGSGADAQFYPFHSQVKDLSFQPGTPEPQWEG